jgi:hypothetical protein
MFSKPGPSASGPPEYFGRYLLDGADPRLCAPGVVLYANVYDLAGSAPVCGALCVTRVESQCRAEDAIARFGTRPYARIRITFKERKPKYESDR